MTALIGGSERPLFSGAWSDISDNAKAQNYDRLVAYGGRFTAHEDRVVHHVDVCWIPNWEGTDLERFVTFLPDGKLLAAHAADEERAAAAAAGSDLGEGSDGVIACHRGDRRPRDPDRGGRDAALHPPRLQRGQLSRHRARTRHDAFERPLLFPHQSEACRDGAACGVRNPRQGNERHLDRPGDRPVREIHPHAGLDLQPLPDVQPWRTRFASVGLDVAFLDGGGRADARRCARPSAQL